MQSVLYNPFDPEGFIRLKIIWEEQNYDLWRYNCDKVMFFVLVCRVCVCVWVSEWVSDWNIVNINRHDMNLLESFNNHLLQSNFTQQNGLHLKYFVLCTFYFSETVSKFAKQCIEHFARNCVSIHVWWMMVTMSFGLNCLLVIGTL